MTIRQNGQILAGAVTGPYKANIDMDNLTDVGKNIANWSNNVTNCITEIPQDIKLELNDGTLTLKAGSKVYVPNGFESDGTTPKFDVVTIENDMSISSLWTGSGTGSRVNAIFLSQDNTLKVIGIDYQNSSWWSGSNPTITKTYGYRYNTTTNLIQKTSDTGSTWIGNYSLPIALVSADNNKTPVSIDQVFNGFGYIGSTVFALPNIKFSSLKGRNLDGTYITHTITNTSIKTITRTSAWSNVCAYCGWNNDSNEVNALIILKDVIIVKKLPDSFQNYTVYINLEDGFTYYKGAAGVDIVRSDSSAYKFATLSFGTNGTISDFNICSNVFSAINFQDSALVSGWSMPSGRYIDLTLGASGANYTAPANGWFYCVPKFTTDGWFQINNETSGGIRAANLTQTSIWSYAICYVPCKKGDVLHINYYGTITSSLFRFIYAEGEQ